MLDLNYLELFKNFPPQLAIFIMAMIPIAELRVALPWAIGIYNLPLWQAYFIAVIGNIVPVFFILFFIDPVSRFLMSKSKLFRHFFNWLFSRTRIKFEGKYARWGFWALAIFVAIPLPITGAWTGALAAFLFQIPKKQAAIYISLGVLGAGIIVSILTLSAMGAVNFF